MNKLLTQKDLAERWKVTVATITDWRNQRIITPCKGIPSIRFTEQHIAELEGIKLDRFSPLERRKLERENEILKKQNEEMKEIISNILSQAIMINKFNVMK